MPFSSNNDILEYVILIYSGGKVITIIGFADWKTTVESFREACAQNSAAWAYLVSAQGAGTILAEYHEGIFTGI